MATPPPSRSPDRSYRPPPEGRGAPASERVRVRRDTKHRGRYDAAALHPILDATPFCHLGYVHEGHPVVIPTLQVRVGDVVYLHASSGSRIGLAAPEDTTGPEGAASGSGGQRPPENLAGEPWPVCLTVTLVEGLVMARSGFNHSINYRSAVMMGEAVLVTDPTEKLMALDATVDHVAPGRAAEVRPPTTRELEATVVARLPLSESSVKVRTGPPVDEPEDVTLPIWAGVIPLTTTYGQPIPAPDLPSGVPLPASVRAVVDRT